MASVLSQEEIDALLQSFVSEEGPAAFEEVQETSNVKEYDFRTANKFSKENVRTLNIVFENFAQLFSNYLTSKLRTASEVEILSIEEQMFNEFNNALPLPCILVILNMNPLEGSVLMELSPEIAYAMIDKLFGGSGGGHVTLNSKNFTEIEISILERFIRKILPLMVEAWARILKIETSLERMETSSQFAQIVASNETVVIITMNVTIGKSSGLINFCIPHVAIQPVSQQLSTRLFFSSNTRKAKASREADLRYHLTNTPITLQAVFNETTATVSDILSLQEGDVIQLNQKVSEPILVKVEHIPKFYCAIGTHGRNYAAQIVDIIKEDRVDE